MRIALGKKLLQGSSLLILDDKPITWMSFLVGWSIISSVARFHLVLRDRAFLRV